MGDEVIWWRCLVNAVITFMFMLKWSYDIEKTRMLWFFSLIVSLIFNSTLCWMAGYKEVYGDEGVLWQSCTDMKNDGHSWASMGVTDMEGCIAHIKPYASAGFWGCFGLSVLVNLHFMHVTYTHWQQHDLS